MNQIDQIFKINYMDQAYILLGLKIGATKEQILKAYKLKAIQMHPDKGGNDESFRKISESKDLLLNHQSLPNTMFHQCSHNATSNQSTSHMNSFTPSFNDDSYKEFIGKVKNMQGFMPNFNMKDLQDLIPNDSNKNVKNYVFNGNYLSHLAQKQYINVRTNRTITNLNRNGFTYLDISKNGQGPFFCGLNNDLIEFKLQNKID